MLASPVDAEWDGSVPGGKVEKNRMKKELGLLEGVAIILGIIFGSGKYSVGYTIYNL